MAVAETPLMKQHKEIKQKYPDAILLFRVGDFYETFSEDAVKASSILGITLTRRANGVAQFVELAGFPYHALDTYLPKLVRSGLRVAICEQMEDPKKAKGLVERDIIELVTPAVSMNDNVLEVKENNFLASIYVEKKKVGLSLLDITTGEFMVTEGTAEHIDKLVQSFQPKEILYQEGKKNDAIEVIGGKWRLQHVAEWCYARENAIQRLTDHFEVKNLKGFGVEEMETGLVAAGVILYYLDDTKHSNTKHIRTLSRIDDERYVWMDVFTVRNLELLGTMAPGGKTLSQVIDGTVTPMGGRMLRRWISFPLKDVNEINARQEIVTQMFRDPEMRNQLMEELVKVGDMERIASKVGLSRVVPRDIWQLGIGLRAVGEIKKILGEVVDCDALKRMADMMNGCSGLCDRIENTLTSECGSLQKGGFIREGVDNELDELRDIVFNGKDYLLKMQQREAEKTGISSLKIGYTNVFGYYMEVRNTHKDKVPAEWIRKQTLANAERYITEELKEYENKIVTAEMRIGELEARLFGELVATTLEYLDVIQTNCMKVATLDCLVGFALVSARYGYNQPVVDNSDRISIAKGRHPVIERLMAADEHYVPNDIGLDHEKQQIMIITGPNMAGKSALLRQTALIVLMAQIGCYVPAESAHIGVVDKIFTRVGASDNLSVGDSTFMVEMNEAATILNNMTDRSLVLFDELGRGTSTYDGISIAWSIVEYIHETKGKHALTLFATHYHELNDMEKAFARIKNWNVSVCEVDKKVIFLRKLERGGSEHSFGIHVAKMAGMPNVVVKRADELLEGFESKDDKGKVVVNVGSGAGKKDKGIQLSMFALDDPTLEAVRDEIIKVDINQLTPLEALNKLSEIKKIVSGKS